MKAIRSKLEKSKTGSYLLILLLILVFNFSLVIAYQIGVSRSRQTEDVVVYDTTKRETGEAVLISPIPTPEAVQPNIARFRPYTYGLMRPFDDGVGTKTYHDELLKVSFGYPANLTVAGVGADSKNPSAVLYLTKFPTPKTVQHIDYAIECEKGNRKGPAGTCIEWVVTDIDLYISKFEPDQYQKSRERDLEDDDCEKDEVNSQKIVFSCLTGSVAGYPIHRYSVYFSKGDDNYHATIYAQNISLLDKEIRLIIDSLAVD